MIDKASHLTLVVVKFCSHNNFKLVKEQFIFAKDPITSWGYYNRIETLFW